MVFRLSGELYGVSIEQIREIIPFQAITRVPHTPDYVVGVTNLRGRVIPVIDLRLRLGLPAGPPKAEHKIAVAENDGITVGMIVDGVSEVLQVNSTVVEPVPPMAVRGEARHIKGVAKLEDRILLDLPRTLGQAGPGGF